MGSSKSTKLSARPDNYKRNPQHLKRGGKKHKTPGVAELAYCAKIAAGMTREQASIEVGKHRSQGYNWERRNPLIRAQIEEYRKQFREDAANKVRRDIELRTAFLDEQTISRLCRAKKTDIAVAKLIHTGYQRTGAIKSSSVSAVAQAGAAAVVGGTMAEIYKSKWLRDKELQLATQLEHEYTTPSE